MARVLTLSESNAHVVSRCAVKRLNFAVSPTRITEVSEKLPRFCVPYSLVLIAFPRPAMKLRAVCMKLTTHLNTAPILRMPGVENSTPQFFFTMHRLIKQIHTSLPF
jgi:hypothetical protein